MKEMTIKLPRELFDDHTIIKGSLDYRELADICIKDQKEKYYLVSVRNCRYDTLQTTREFENYLIDLQNTVRNNVD